MATDERDGLHRNVVDNLFDGVYYVDRSRTIMYWNHGAERITGFAAGETVGHRCMDNLLMHCDAAGTSLCQSMCPLAHTMNDGELRETRVSLRHKDGQRLPVTVRSSPIHSPAGAIIGAVEIFTDDTTDAPARREMDELRRAAQIDHLTGVANRRYIDLLLPAALEEAYRFGWPCSVLFVDIDHFKAVNDLYGHAAGDAVLRVVAETLRGACRAKDVVGRWGGEEFLVIVPDADAAGLRVLAARMLALVRRSQTPWAEGPITATVSIGGATARPGEPAAALVTRADALMYTSKREGRDRATLDLA